MEEVRQSPVGADHSTPIADFFTSTRRQIRQAILDQAVEEQRDRGIIGFALDAVARRTGVPTVIVERLFGQRRDLLVEAALDTTRRIIPQRDTGSLAGDLVEFAIDKAAAVHTEKARTYLNSLLPRGHSTDAEALRDMWRLRFTEVGQMFGRAEGRGELRAGIDPGHAIRMIASALFYDPFFTDQPVRPAYAIEVLEIFLNGVYPPHLSTD